PGNFALGRVFGLHFYPIAFTLSKTDTSVALTPVAPLAYNQPYRVVVKTGVQDTSGNHLAQEKRVAFTTYILPGTERIIDLGNGVDLTLVWIPPGTFDMGSLDTNPDALNNEKPRHEVTLTQGFWMGKYEVTQAQWKHITGYNLSFFHGDNLPVEMVSWDDVQNFIAQLNQFTGKTFSLPTEAQWEYAARGDVPGNTYSGGDDVGEVGWYKDNSNDTTHPVGHKSANAWGLHDMSGNVYEWCQDWYGVSYYASSPSQDPTGPDSGTCRVIRGGSWIHSARHLRSADRLKDSASVRAYDLGFRLVMQP
ncbi:MAG: hypothetical protein CSA76_06820, partial [Spirochaetales bacterium]